MSKITLGQLDKVIQLSNKGVITRKLLQLFIENPKAVLPPETREQLVVEPSIVESTSFVEAISDTEAVELLVKQVKNKSLNSELLVTSGNPYRSLVIQDGGKVVEEAKAKVAAWRQYANDRGYTGRVAWKVKEGFTLKTHASLAGPCHDNLQYLQNWQLRNDEPTQNSLVFWIPRLVENSTSKNIKQMEAHRAELQKRYNFPERHCTEFGSIALLFALILAHFKRTGERVPLKDYYAASDTLHANGSRLYAGYFDESGLYCGDWWDDDRDGSVGFFLLGVETLGH